MTKKWTHKECFECFGVVPRNLRWSWSGRSPDGKTVAVTFWKDEFEDRGRVYRVDSSRRAGKWVGSPAHRELIENVTWAMDHCGGELRIIIAIPKNPAANPRSIKECHPQENLRMRVVDFDASTGDFVVERIDPL